MSSDPHIHIESDNGGKGNVFVRIAIIIGILFILFLIAIGIVRFVPKILSSFGQANVSLTSLFGNASSTPQSTNQSVYYPNQQSYQNNQNTVSGNQGATLTEPARTQTNSNQNPNQTRTNTTYSNSTSNTRSTSTYTYPTTRSTGVGDLAISLVKIGRVLPNGTFESTSNFNAGDRVTIQFNISNVGNGYSGPWTLSARLPTQISYEQNYTSVTEPSIAPGSSYNMTLAFDSFDSTQSSIQIVINGNDTNKSNNTLITNVTGSGTNYNYNNNYNNGCYYQNGTYYCSNTSYNYNYNYNNNCYYQNGNYYCNNNNYNYNNNNGCYYQNGYYYCSNNTSNTPDLQVRIISTGVVNKTTGQFTSTNTITRNDRAAVQVEIRNIGNVTTGNWNWTANLSGVNGSNGTFSSGSMNQILPGQSSVYTATFDNPQPGQQTISVQANEANGTYEAYTSNNYASQGIYISY